MATTQNFEQQEIIDRFWERLRDEVSKAEVSCIITQALIRVFVNNKGKTGLLRGFWCDTIKEIFSENSLDISTPEEFVDFCESLLNDKNKAVDFEKWTVLTNCFQKFCYDDISAVMSYYDIAEDKYFQRMQEKTRADFKAIVRKSLDSYAKFIGTADDDCRDSVSMPILAFASGGQPVEDESVLDRVVIASYLSLPSDILEVYFKGELDYINNCI